MMIRRERATATAVALLAAAYNVAVNRVLPQATHVPANLVAAAFATALGRTAAHASWSELGLGREQLRRGLVMGGAVSLAAAGIVGAAAVTPATGRFFVDERVHEVSPPAAAYEVGVRIPFATALPEEVVFRGVLLGVLQRSHTETTSIAWTSTLFGLWHLLPTLDTMHSNPVREELPARPRWPGGGTRGSHNGHRCHRRGTRTVAQSQWWRARAIHSARDAQRDRLRLRPRRCVAKAGSQDWGVSESSSEGQQAEPGRLRTYLGTAPGVGKTYAMLNDGWRRSQDGERVVVGWIERHGRPETKAQLRDLQLIPGRSVDYRGSTFLELDVDAVIAAQPDVVLVDELAHTHVDGIRKRWEDAEELLAAGIAVMTTVNIANLRSVRDYAARVTGAGMVESVPDEIVRAGEIVLIDLSPGALRERIAAGQVYSADRVGGALANYFRPSNLAALSELARAWLAGTLDAVARDVLAREGVGPEVARPTVLAAVSGSAWGEHIIRKAAKLAAEDDADLLVVHVNVIDGLGGRSRRADLLDRLRELTVESGGSYSELDGSSVAEVLASAARDLQATRVVVARHRSRLGEILRGSVARRIRRLVPDISVHEVRPERTAR